MTARLEVALWLTWLSFHPDVEVFDASPRDIATLENDWSYFADHLTANGRSPENVDRVALQYLHLVPTDDPDIAGQKQHKAYGRLLGGDRSVEYAEQNWLFGTAPEIRDTVPRYDRLGFDELVLYPVTNTPGELETQLERWRDHLLSAYQ